MRGRGGARGCPDQPSPPTPPPPAWRAAALSSLPPVHPHSLIPSPPLRAFAPSHHDPGSHPASWKCSPHTTHQLIFLKSLSSNNTIRTWAKHLSRHSSNEDRQISDRHEQGCPHEPSGRGGPNPQGANTSRPLCWPQKTSAGEDQKKQGAPHCWRQGTRGGAAVGNIWQFLKRLSQELL